MTLQARIMYQYEVDEVGNRGALSALPIVEHLFAIDPQADPRAVIYTAEQHLQAHGLEAEYPNEVIVPDYLIPQPEVKVARSAESPVLEEEDDAVDLDDLFSDSDDDADAPKPRQRRNLSSRRQRESKAKDNVNVRGLMEEIEKLQL